MGIRLPLMMMQRIAAGGGGGITATFQGSAVDPANASTYTFTSQPIGSASATRRVVVVAVTRAANGSAYITNVTIGGVAASFDADSGLVSNNSVVVASAVITSGTTADIVVTTDSTSGRCGIGVWTLDDGAPTGNTATGGGVDPIDLTVTTTAGDVVIGGALWVQAGGSAAWTGATERYDGAVESTNILHSGADTTATGASTAISVSTATNSAAAAAAYA